MAHTEKRAVTQATPRTPIADFVTNVSQLNNGAMVEIADFMAAQCPEFRARFIERCASMISAVADCDA